MTKEVPYGRRLILHVFEETARDEPDRLLLSAPNSPNDPSKGWRRLSFAQVLNAVDHAAHWLRDQLGLPTGGAGVGDGFPTFAYIGLSDVRYFFLTLAAIKVGYVAFFPSPRNNTEAIVSLFTETKVIRLLHSSEQARLAHVWQDAYPHTAAGPALEVPPVSYFVTDTPARPYPYTDTFASARHHPALILHSSGTTGTPKAIVIRHGYFGAADILHKHAWFNGYENINVFQEHTTTCVLTPVPMFHAYGILKSLADGIYYNVAIATGVPELPVTAENILRSLEHSGADALAVTPSMLDEVANFPHGIDVLKKLRLVMNAGGAISDKTLDLLRANKVTFMNIVSSTESGYLALYYQPDPAKWDYFIFNDSINGAEYSHMHDRIYEQSLVRRPELDEYQAIFITFPERTEYRIGDMYEAHPTLPHHWKYRGRLDSIIVFSTGEKLNPVTMEAIVEDHPEIATALVVGRDRFQAGIILEPRVWPADDNQEAMAALLDRVWPQIEKANAGTPNFARVARSLVMLASADKPFPRTAKGSLRLNVALELYAEEIAQLYDPQQSCGANLKRSSPALDVTSLKNMTAGVRAVLCSVSGSSAVGAANALYGDDDDLFLHGFDSLQALEASRRLTAGLSGPGQTAVRVLPRDIYREQTIARLSRYLFDSVRRGRDHIADDNGPSCSSVPAAQESNTATNTEAMQTLVDRYTAGLNPKDGCCPRRGTDDRPPARASNRTVVLTGSTGSLGSYLLHCLLQSQDVVGKIICLNRASPNTTTTTEREDGGGGEGGGRARQLASFRDRGLPQPAASSLVRVTFLHADLSRPDLGLETPETDLALLRDADCIIHCAWPVNFNLALPSFEGHVRGVRHLVDVALGADRRAAIVFVSSVATVANWKAGEGAVPERYIGDLGLAGTGYGQSKLVSEHILHVAATTAAAAGISLPVGIIRLGQVGGPTTQSGQWNRQEWLPTLLESSVRLGMLPRCLSSMEPIAWVPVDKAAQIVLDVGDALSSSSSSSSLIQREGKEGGEGGGGGAEYFNLTNPHPVAWDSLVPAIRAFYRRRLSQELALVDLATWVDAVRAVPLKNQARMPALKLLDTFEAMADADKEEKSGSQQQQQQQQQQQLVTEKLQSVSKTLAQLEPLTPHLVSLWCQQWDFSKS